MANNNWNNYTEKTATPVDADEVMVRDSADGKNKKLLFGTFWKWVAKKLNEATISELQTSNKTIVGALNQLNSDIGHFPELHYYKINQTKGSTQTFTFTDFEGYRFPFIYVHGSQIEDNNTVFMGIFDGSSNSGYILKLHGNAEISFENATITSYSQESWANGFIIY